MAEIARSRSSYFCLEATYLANGRLFKLGTHCGLIIFVYRVNALGGKVMFDVLGLPAPVFVFVSMPFYALVPMF